MVWKRADDTPEHDASVPQPSRGPAPGPTAARRERAVIGESITIQGDLAGEEDLTILGRVQGKVDVQGNSVTIGESGHVKADVYGKTIIVEGRVEGNLFGGEQIVLRSTGDVRGNLTAPRVSLEDGAQFKGAIDMEPGKRSGARGAEAAGGAATAPAAGRASSPAAASEGPKPGAGEPVREKAAAKAGA